MTTVAEGIAAGVTAVLYAQAFNIIKAIHHGADSGLEKYNTLLLGAWEVKAQANIGGINVTVTAGLRMMNAAVPRWIVVVDEQGGRHRKESLDPVVAYWWRAARADGSMVAGNPSVVHSLETGHGMDTLQAWIIGQVGTQEEDIAVKAKALLDALDEVDL